jgi:hypothetical protein
LRPAPARSRSFAPRSPSLVDRALAFGDEAFGGLARLGARGLPEHLEAALEALDVAPGLVAMFAEGGRELFALGGFGELRERVEELPLGTQQVLHRMVQDVLQVRDGHGGASYGRGAPRGWIAERVELS